MNPEGVEREKVKDTFLETRSLNSEARVRLLFDETPSILSLYSD